MTEHELVMPFIVVASKGGPYDDESFVAGWSCAVIDETLSQIAPSRAVLHRTVRSAVLSQLDLIAMRHGYQIVQTDPKADKDRADGWALIELGPHD